MLRSVIALLFAASCAFAQFDPAVFKSPPAQYRGHAMWSFPLSTLNENYIVSGIREMAKLNYGGFFIEAGGGPTTGLSEAYLKLFRRPQNNQGVVFLSDEFFRFYKLALEEAKKQGLEVVLYDDYSFPTGTVAGQLYSKYPQHVAKSLEMTEKDVSGPVRVELELSDKRAVARLDRRKLLDALRALVDNARAAMAAGGTLTLATDVRNIEPTSVANDRVSQRFAMLEVRDSGEGMSDEVRARLFEPFFSTQPFGANHGMGLASVHGMVAQSQGFIECDSILGKGTALRLFFPVATEPERVVTTPSGSRAVTGRGVLLVDDDPMLRDLAARMLERHGHSAAVVESGAEALALLASGAVQLSVMVTDLTMPGMSGMELIAEVTRRYPHLPIVAISGFSMNPAVRQVLDDHHVPFVGKPFSAEELEKAMDQALAEKASPAS